MPNFTRGENCMMMEKFKSLLMKKAKEQQENPVDEKKMKAKAAAAKELSDALSEDIGSKIKNGLSKVTVASSSPEGLKAGLEKAEELVSPEEEMEDESEEMENESEESEGESEESPEEIQMKIKELEKQLEMLKNKRIA